MNKPHRNPARIWISALIFLAVTSGCILPTFSLKLGSRPTAALKNTRQAALPTSRANETPSTDGLPTPASTQPIIPIISEACALNEQKLAMRSGFDPQVKGIDACYDLSLLIDKSGKNYTGSEKLTFVNSTGKDLSEIVLRLYPNADEIYGGGQLTVDELQIDNNSIQADPLLQDRTALRIPLKKPLSDGASVVLTMRFTGAVPDDLASTPGYGIFNYSADEPVLTLANWYPILAEWQDDQWQADPVAGPGDAVVSTSAYFRVKIQAPDGWKVVSTGTEGQDGSNTTFSGPVRDFIVVASPSFVTNSQVVDGTTVTHWALKGVSDSNSETLSVAVGSVKIYNEKFGPYPFNEFDVVDVPLQYAGGVEYPGLVLIESDLYSGDSSASDFLVLVVAHETAHQWWYSTIGNDVLKDPWQDEGLTSFSELVYLQQADPSAYAEDLSYFRERVKAADRGGKQKINQPVQAFENNEEAYSDVVYDKTAIFFVELRKKIGDDAFFEALKQYYQSNMYQLAAPSTLLGSFEASCGCDLRQFYQDWGAE